jgi:glycosyltransferase involved in cell wall biosynthesis
LAKTARIKVAIMATHPIQYQVPWFRRLATEEGIELIVYYSFLPDETLQGDGFGVPFQWDIPMLDGYRWEALSGRRVPSGPAGFFRGGAYKTFAKERPDVVILTGWQAPPLLRALWACMRLGIPRAVRGESNALRRRPLWIRLLHKVLLSRFDAFLAIGKANKEFYLEYGVPREKVFTCNYFVDNQRFGKGSGEASGVREGIRSAWGIKKEDACFLFSGKLIPKKRIFDLLSAFEKARRRSEKVYLLVVGAGELMESAKQFASERNLPVAFAGFLNQTEIVKAYAAADCLVLPSDYGETWGLVVNEAMACGLPAIVSDRVGCGPDLIENGVTGRIFPFGDTKALAGIMLEMAADREQLACMGRKARKKVEAYSVENAVEGTLQAVHAVFEAQFQERSASPRLGGDDGS